MGKARTASRRARALGTALILFVGLLTFHVPHFVVESATVFDVPTYLLELVFLIHLLGAIVAAVGIARDSRWGWLLGMAIVALSFMLYVAQETVGLPGLPKNWLEPSRIVAVIIEVSFLLVAARRLVSVG